MKNFLIMALTLFAVTACSKEEDPFQQEKNRLQGLWLLTEITGGIAGTGYEANFSHLEMTSQDRYALLDRESSNILQEGDYRLRTENEELIITFTPDDSEEVFFYDVEKTVTFGEQDQLLTLSDPCCDLFVYQFEREEE